MKIAYFVNHIGQTGVNQVVSDLAAVMGENGHGCKIFYLRKSDAPMAFPCDVSMLKSTADLQGYDVIHAHGIGPEQYLLRHCWHRWKNERGTRTKLVTTLHCYCFQDFQDLYGAVKGFLLGLLYLLAKIPFDRVVCLSQNMMQYYQKFISKRKLTFAYNTSILESEEKLSEEEKLELETFKGDATLIGMNCVLLYRKGIDVMLKAMTLLPLKYKLFIAGDGKERNVFEKMTHDLGIADRVYFAGQRKNAYRYLPYYDIYALPSRSEGFPISLLEAAAYGNKVVASKLPIVEECFSDDEISKFEMPDENALAEAVIKLETDSDIGSRLQKVYQEKFSPEKFYERHLFIYIK